MQVLRRGEATACSNVGYSKAVVFQTFGGSGEFEAQNLIMHAAATRLAKMRFQGRAGNTDISGDLIGLDTLAGVLADKQQGLHHVRVAQGLMQAGGLHVDGVRRHQHLGARAGFAMQHLMQQCRSGTAHGLRALDHRTERHPREGAGQRVVVDADQRHLLRHRNTRRQAGLQQLPSAGIGHRDDADRLGQAVQPGNLLLHRAVPQRRTGAQAAIHLYLQAIALHQAAKSFLTLLGPPIGLGFGQAETGKPRQPRLHQMLVGQLHQGMVIGGHIGNALGVLAHILIRPTHRHHRYPTPSQRLADQRVIEVSNDAVPLPTLDTAQAAEEVLFQEQVPGCAGAAQVIANAGDDAAVVDLAAVEQQGDAVNGR
ncbi:hypothetical protein ALP29_05281 [Pseudomonas syringae pv. avii]|uniref:Uncharacterized protein n=1 Tax=Pseudomonas syringae pv. avii TaxID=663959 RepID=A0A3M5U2H3_PSESX|nr:hypothetical protein ALP43_04912 [Pseudomonas azotoformans]RMU39976.1 hypothetical protein ALP29_05281 [Pseudomonas syringae pv. avii]